MKNKVKNAVFSGLAYLIVGGGAFITEYMLNIRDLRQREIQERLLMETQKELLEVDRYLQAIENPEDFDGFYILGWGMQVPDRYRRFIEDLQALSNQ